MSKGLLPKIVDSLRYRWGMLLNRSEKFYRSFNSDQHQLTSTTSAGRYPKLFGELQQIAGVNPLRILSFGCSTGEECFSLVAYFPGTAIVGADINKSNLQKAREQNKFQQVTFIHSSPDTIKESGPYNIILCLSVLCRWEDTKDLEDCGGIYPFKKFESITSMLTNNLTDGGFLVIYNSNFRFEEASSFRNGNFNIIPTAQIPDSGFVHKFDSNNRRVRETHTACVYQKGKKLEHGTGSR